MVFHFYNRWDISYVCCQWNVFAFDGKPYTPVLLTNLITIIVALSFRLEQPSRGPSRLMCCLLIPYCVWLRSMIGSRALQRLLSCKY